MRYLMFSVLLSLALSWGGCSSQSDPAVPGPDPDPDPGEVTEPLGFERAAPFVATTPAADVLELNRWALRIGSAPDALTPIDEAGAFGLDLLDIYVEGRVMRPEGTTLQLRLQVPGGGHYATHHGVAGADGTVAFKIPVGATGLTRNNRVGTYGLEVVDASGEAEEVLATGWFDMKMTSDG